MHRRDKWWMATGRSLCLFELMSFSNVSMHPVPSGHTFHYPWIMCMLTYTWRPPLLERQTNALLHHIISVPTSSARRNILATTEAFVKSHSRRSLQTTAVQVPANAQKKHADNLIYTISRFEGKARGRFQGSHWSFLKSPFEMCLHFQPQLDDKVDIAWIEGKKKVLVGFLFRAP